MNGKQDRGFGGNVVAGGVRKQMQRLTPAVAAVVGTFPGS